MTKSLEQKVLIKSENLSNEFYFQSLLQEALRVKLLTDLDLETIQMKCLLLLAEQTRRYTSGDSSSVKVEVAQNIMKSILYTIGITLKSLPTADSSVAQVKEKPLAELFQAGKCIIQRQIKVAKILLIAAQKNSILTDNRAYNDTVKGGIDIFFSSYDVDFTAHDTPASIDYPLYDDTMSVTGIEYIRDYVYKLHLENQFCQHFDAGTIHELLLGYDEHYSELLINIFEHVLTNAVGCILANKDVVKLNLLPSDIHYLQSKLQDLSDKDLKDVCQHAMAQLFDVLTISGASLQEYILLATNKLTEKIKCAILNNSISTVFITSKKTQMQAPLTVECGRGLDDDAFRKFVAELGYCRFVQDKIKMIRNRIHNYTDLHDILDAECFDGDEYTTFFDTFGDLELAVLLKRLPAYVEVLDMLITENQKDWHRNLINYFAKMDSSRNDTIRKLTRQMQLV